jgi:hypothetical protein
MRGNCPIVIGGGWDAVEELAAISPARVTNSLIAASTHAISAGVSGLGPWDSSVHVLDRSALPGSPASRNSGGWRLEVT